MKPKVLSKLSILLLVTSFTLPMTALAAEEGMRTPVPEESKSQYPYNLTYAINVNKDNAAKMRGTGTLIGNNWMLTAGHMLTNNKGLVGNGTKVNGESNGSSHALTLKAYKKNVFAASPFKVNYGYAGFSDLGNDVALIKITEPQATNTPQVPLTVYSNLQSLVGQTVSTMGYSSYYYGDYTETSGKVVSVEEDGTLTVNMPVAQQNSGSPVYLNGEIIGVLTAIGPGQGFIMGDTATVTPFTPSIKANLFDPNGIPVTVK